MKSFKSDTRGIGGQKQVVELMKGHYTAVVKAKSTLNTREKPVVHMKKQQ